MKKAYILLAEGFEVIEALAPIDILCRAGVKVQKVAVGESLIVSSSHNHTTLLCHSKIEDTAFDDGDIIILPGGNPGYVNLGRSKEVISIVQRFYEQGRLIAAICGAPTIFAIAGIAKEHSITYHSSVRDMMSEYHYAEKSVIKDRNIITAAGAGHSIAFGIEIAKCLVDADTLSRTQQGMEL